MLLKRIYEHRLALKRGDDSNTLMSFSNRRQLTALSGQNKIPKNCRICCSFFIKQPYSDAEAIPCNVLSLEFKKKTAKALYITIFNIVKWEWKYCSQFFNNVLSSLFAVPISKGIDAFLMLIRDLFVSSFFEFVNYEFTFLFSTYLFIHLLIDLKKISF